LVKQLSLSAQFGLIGKIEILKDLTQFLQSQLIEIRDKIIRKSKFMIN
jgi:hypothetical protein